MGELRAQAVEERDREKKEARRSRESEQAQIRENEELRKKIKELEQKEQDVILLEEDTTPLKQLYSCVEA